MLDVSTENEVTKRTLLLGAFRSVLPQGQPQQATNHWSQRLKDPLGRALTRLHGQRDVLDLIESTLSPVETHDPVRTAPPVVSDNTEGSILPLQPVSSGSVIKLSNGAERRRFPRRQSECSVAFIERRRVLELTPQQTDWMLQSTRSVGRLLDISQSGLCLLVENDLTVGSEVLLRISNRELNRQFDSSATVVRSQPSTPGRFSVHCVVLREFTLDQLQDLGRPLISAHVLA